MPSGPDATIQPREMTYPMGGRKEMKQLNGDPVTILLNKRDMRYENKVHHGGE